MPEDKKPKPSQKPSLSTIAKLVGRHAIPLVGPMMTARDFISKVSLDRMAKNLDPYDYGKPGQGSISRFIDAVVLNKPEEERTETEQFLEKGYGRVPAAAYKERIDLLQMLAGKPQKYNTIEGSNYIPNIDPEKGASYVRGRGIESEIVKDLNLGQLTIRNEKDLEDLIKSKSYDKGKRGYVAVIPGLGGATYNFNRDKKGLYIDYRDVWDLNPQKGAYAEQQATPYTTMESLQNLGESALKSLGTYVVNATATPAKVYGRIYFDPKTGKPILENGPTNMPVDRIKKVLSNKSK